MEPAASALPNVGLSPSIAASLAGAGGSLLNTLFGSFFGANQAKKQREWATNERIASQQWQEDMWNKNNIYNSAKFQIARLKEAGLSPNLLYGSGAIAGSLGGTPSAPSTPGGGSPMPFVPMDLTSLQNYFLKKEELRNQAFHNETERIAVMADIPGQEGYARNQNAIAAGNEFFNNLNNKIEIFLEMTAQDKAYLTHGQRRYQDTQNDIYERTGLAIAMQELSNLKKTFEEISARTGLAYSQIALNFASAEAQSAMADELASRSYLNYTEAEKVVQETVEVIRTGDINAFEKILHAYDGGILSTVFKIIDEQSRLGNGQSTVRSQMMDRTQDRGYYEGYVRDRLPLRKRRRR